MNKKILILIVIGVLVIVGGILVYWYWESIKAEICYLKLSKISGYGAYMPNPASYFCTCMGGNLGTEKTSTGGEKGLCKIGSETYYDWEYYNKMNPRHKEW